MVPNQVNEIPLSEFGMWDGENDNSTGCKSSRCGGGEERQRDTSETERGHYVCSTCPGLIFRARWLSPEPPEGLTAQPRLYPAQHSTRPPEMLSWSSFLPMSLDITWASLINLKKSILFFKKLAFSWDTYVQGSICHYFIVWLLASRSPSLGLILLLSKERKGPEGSPRTSRIPVPGSISCIFS